MHILPRSQFLGIFHFSDFRSHRSSEKLRIPVPFNPFRPVLKHFSGPSNRMRCFCYQCKPSYPKVRAGNISWMVKWSVTTTTTTKYSGSLSQNLLILHSSQTRRNTGQKLGDRGNVSLWHCFKLFRRTSLNHIFTAKGSKQHAKYWGTASRIRKVCAHALSRSKPLYCDYDLIQE